MQDHPTPSEILTAVARFLKETVAPATTGHVSFNARVAANALEMMRRNLDLAPAAEAAEHERLKAMLGVDGDLATLNAELAGRIAAGEMDLETPGLKDHLWTVTLDKLAVDQPTYAAYRASLAERGEKSPLPAFAGRGLGEGSLRDSDPSGASQPAAPPPHPTLSPAKGGGEGQS